MVRFNRNAQAFVGKFTFFMVFIIIAFIFLSVYIMMITSYFQEQYPLPKYTEIDNIASRVSVCLAYQDPETGHVYQNILDQNKIKDVTLKYCFVSPYNVDSARIVVTSDKTERLIAQTSSSIDRNSLSVKNPCLLKLSTTHESVPCHIEVFK